MPYGQGGVLLVAMESSRVELVGDPVGTKVRGCWQYLKGRGP